MCVALALAVLAAKSYFGPVAEESRPEVFPARTELPAAYPRPAGTGQLLVAFQPDCGFCIDSVPFYKKLSAYCQRVGIDFRVITLQSPSVVRAIVVADEGHDVDVVQMPHFDFSGTPAVVLTDAQNRVVASWLGWLSPRLEQEVIAAIEGFAGR
jgi:hypothetical protein